MTLNSDQKKPFVCDVVLADVAELDTKVAAILK